VPFSRVYGGAQGSGARILQSTLGVGLLLRPCCQLLQLALSWLFLAGVSGAFIGYVLWKQHEKDYHDRKEVT
jgi:hypothetical protein